MPFIRKVRVLCQTRLIFPLINGPNVLSHFVIIVVTFEGGATKERMSHSHGPVWQHCKNTSVGHQLVARVT